MAGQTFEVVELHCYLASESCTTSCCFKDDKYMIFYPTMVQNGSFTFLEARVRP